MYARHFGLRAEAFSLTPDPAFLYRSPGHSEALAALSVGLRGRRGLMVMTGEVGTGKTTLLYSLLSELGSEVRTAYISNTKLSFDQILQQALSDFGVPCPGGDRLEQLNALNAFLRSCATDGATAALVIDEAQNLDIEGFENLRLLSNFETFTSKLLQIVLVGQPELDFKLKSPNLRQVAERVAVHCHINPLSRSESRNYVEHRLQCVGGSLDLFTPSALRLAIRRSQGIPRRINIICHNALLFAYGHEARRVSRSHVRAAVHERNGRGLVITGSSGHAAHTTRKRWLGPWLAAPGTMVVTLTALTLSWKGGSLWQAFPARPTTSARVDSLEDGSSRSGTDRLTFTGSMQKGSPPYQGGVRGGLKWPVDSTSPPPPPSGNVDKRETRPSTGSGRADKSFEIESSTARAELVEARSLGKSTIPNGGGSLAQTTSALALVGEDTQPSNAPAAFASERADAAPDAAGRGTDEPHPVSANAADTQYAANDPVLAPPPPPPDSRLGRHEDGARRTRKSIKAADPPRFRLVHVAHGATLGSLTREVYGMLTPDLLKRVRSANPQIADLNHILAGDTLRFPLANVSGQTAAMINQGASRTTP